MIKTKKNVLEIGRFFCLLEFSISILHRTYTEVVFNCRIKYSLKTNSALYQIDFQLRHLTSKLVLIISFAINHPSIRIIIHNRLAKT